MGVGREVWEDGAMGPVDESPQTQMNGLYEMMWPGMNPYEADVVMQDDAWMDFLRGGESGFGGEG